MFNTAQVAKLYDYDLRPQLSDGARERFLEKGSPFVLRPAPSFGAFRVSLKELLKPEVFEELCRRFR